MSIFTVTSIKNFSQRDYNAGTVEILGSLKNICGLSCHWNQYAYHMRNEISSKLIFPEQL